ncbi:MAG TPA: 30S ribosomal protein S12 methylthiotransferase RimO [Gammaproteobacteria bacterium]|nr:ribosomal protein S12 methylthiotransferase RimO [bacterium BMS3Abin11]HDH16969.1 30S ribosomal protein S12 methylthiotransferase RimO [Gammaproteobacteria bacterium]
MTHHIPSIGFISLGCPKALVDSEQIITRLRAEGYAIQPDYKSSDVVVINTCAFIDDAVAESMQAISEAMNENGKVIVTGCLGAKQGVVEQAFPDLLAVTGPHAADEVMAAIHLHLPPDSDPKLSLIPPGGIKLTPRHYAYLKISEGCNHRCTFCIIPSLRGGLVSRPVSEVMDEAEVLISAGVKELLVVSQDTSAYGLDTRYRNDFWRGKPLKTRFLELCKALGELGSWVRLHYVYPYPHVDKVIPLMAEGIILPYLDVPLQHANHDILKAMKRPANAENVLRRIEDWRQTCPDITLRSTFIVGFPGETEEQFEELLDFLQEAQLDRVGAFAYSPVDGAAANDLENPVPEEIKQDRLRRFMALQEEISEQRLATRVGHIEDIIIDGKDEEGYIGRSKSDAPEIDGIVFIDSNKDLMAGDIVRAKITDHSAHDLWAETVE